MTAGAGTLLCPCLMGQAGWPSVRISQTPVRSGKEHRKAKVLSSGLSCGQETHVIHAQAAERAPGSPGLGRCVESTLQDMDLTAWKGLWSSQLEAHQPQRVGILGCGEGGAGRKEAGRAVRWSSRQVTQAQE